MPSRRHELLACAIPRLRKARELDTEPASAPGSSAGTRTLDRSLPTTAVRRLRRAASRWSSRGPAASRRYVDHAAPRRAGPGRSSTSTAAASWRRSTPSTCATPTRLARALGARSCMPDYPLAPEHTWRDSHERARRARRALGRRARRHRAGRRLRRRRPRAGARRCAARPRRRRSRPTCCCTRPGSTSRRARPRHCRRRRAATRGCSSARSGRTPSGGPARPTTSAGPRSRPALADLVRAAAGADVLRHPRPARARLPAAGRAAPPRPAGT